MIKECPLSKRERVQYKGYVKRDCSQGSCAWWLDGAKCCAIVGLVDVLDGTLSVRRVE